MSYWYLATPYTKYPAGTEAAFVLACEQTALLILAGVPVFSPIAHTHPVAVHGKLPLDHSFDWLAVDRPMMEAAKGCVVLRAEGWQDSIGVLHEIRFFRSQGKPVYYMDPGAVPVALQHDPRQLAYAAKRRGAV